ncbi:putative mitochondrial protein, partial [Mucuna pruriens]
MKEEMKALEKNSTWEIVDRSKEKRVVGCRWIYIVQCKSDGTLSDTKQDWLLKGDDEIEKLTLKEKLAT